MHVLVPRRYVIQITFCRDVERSPERHEYRSVKLRLAAEAGEIRPARAQPGSGRSKYKVPPLGLSASVGITESGETTGNRRHA